MQVKGLCKLRACGSSGAVHLCTHMLSCGTCEPKRDGQFRGIHSSKLRARKVSLRAPYLNTEGRAEGVDGNVLAVEAHHRKQLKLRRVVGEELSAARAGGGRGYVEAGLSTHGK
jgi:hypothetical protein